MIHFGLSSDKEFAMEVFDSKIIEVNGPSGWARSFLTRECDAEDFHGSTL